MSGHSKWSTIKHKKAALDSKRGKVFSQIARIIRVSVKEGGSGDPNQNPSLRVGLEKARAANMPNANVERAIERGLGKTKDGVTFSEVTYEGFGPSGVGIMVFAITDNRNRTGSEIRFIFDKAGGSLGGPGSAAYLFSDDPIASGTMTVKVPMPVSDGDRQKIEALIESLEENDDVEFVISNMSSESQS